MAGTGVAAAAAPTQPDIGGAPPPTALSPAAQRAALGAVARARTPGSLGAGVQSVTVGGLTFNAVPFQIQILPAGESTLYFCPVSVTPLVDDGLEDADGVRMVMVGGEEYNHVSAQARYGLDNVNAYRATGDAAYLTRAEVQAQRLIERAVATGGAWFHPYDFDWGAMRPPWYSALGQGYALSLFSRLYELTGDEAYEQAAQSTFASYLDPGPAATPWVAQVDPDGYLWLQEYPGSANEGVFNGFMVAALGIYDFYRVTGDPDALALFRGAATTVGAYAASYRRPAWRSLYCLGDRLTASAAYHEVVIQQMLALSKITDDARFARWATIFENDFPRPAVSGRATVSAGRHTVVRFSATGAVLGSSTLASTATLHVAVSARERIHGHTGSWLLLAAGARKGYWIRESAPHVFVPGELVALAYAPARSLALPAGRHTLHDYATGGAVTATMVLTAGAHMTLPVDVRAVVDGVVQVRVASGPYAGAWIRVAGGSLD